jgi:hypothetical protein
MHNNLLLLLQSQHDIHRNLKHIRHDIRRRERKPLSQRYISHALGFVYLNEREILRLRCVFNVMACILLEQSGKIA